MINKVTLIGRLGKDPEKKTIPTNGTVYAQFSVATNESYKDKEGNWQDSTEWHNVVVWRELAERAEKQLKKGMMVYLEGKITYRNWQDQNGQTRYATEIIASTFRALEKREGAGGGQVPPPVEPPYGNTKGQESSANDMPPPTEDNDDLPF